MLPVPHLTPVITAYSFHVLMMQEKRKHLRELRLAKQGHLHARFVSRDKYL